MRVEKYAFDPSDSSVRQRTDRLALGLIAQDEFSPARQISNGVAVATVRKSNAADGNSGK